MAQIKEHYLNNLSREQQDGITGYQDLQDLRELNMLENLALELYKAVQYGQLDSDYADYLFAHPIEGCDWLKDYMGINVI